MPVVLLAVLVLATASTAGELCVLEGEGMCCNPCDVPYPWGGIGYSTDKESEVCSSFSGLSLSSSNTDPFVNQGTLLELAPLYVWLFAGSSGPAYGFSSGHAKIEGDLQILGYSSYPGPASSSWNPQTSEFFTGMNCGSGTHLLGEFLVLTQPISVERESWGRIKAFWR